MSLNSSQNQPVPALHGADTDRPALLPSEVLAKAADLIEPEGAWTRGWLARGSGGERRGPTSTKAVCFCVEGAVQRFGRWRHWQEPLAFVRRAVGLRYHEALFRWNDDPTRTQSEAVAALRKASELAREAGQ